MQRNDKLIFTEVIMKIEHVALYVNDLEKTR